MVSTSLFQKKRSVNNLKHYKSSTMNELLNKTLSEIVTGNYQTAQVFEKYGLDFCCKGKRQLVSACEEKQIGMENIMEDLNQILETEDKFSEFNKMSLTELAEYIVRVHHSYVRLNMPRISDYIMRIVSKHGDHFLYLKEVYTLFTELIEDMEQHMLKEEMILFPNIKFLQLSPVGNTGILNIKAPIDILELEHEHAGTIMQKIRSLTNNYSAPEEACTTFRLTLDYLKAFEEDLHHHVHLENNILFPKAIAFAEIK